MYVQTGLITIHCAAASAQCNSNRFMAFFKTVQMCLPDCRLPLSETIRRFNARTVIKLSSPVFIPDQSCPFSVNPSVFLFLSSDSSHMPPPYLSEFF